METVFIVAIVTAASALGLGITYLFGKSESLIKKHTSGDVEETLLKLNDFTENVVLAFKQETADDLKKSGKWSKKEGEKLKERAREKLGKLINPSEVMGALDLTSQDLEEYLSDLIEKHVSKSKDGEDNNKQLNSADTKVKVSNTKTKSEAKTSKKG